MARLPKRCKKYSVGKEIGEAVYVHRTYVQQLPEFVGKLAILVPPQFDYAVVKYVAKTSRVSFISCLDFDSAEEPVVGDIVCMRVDGSVRHIKQQSDPFIYHHKWLFVMDDYSGFNVANSKARSIKWLGLSGIDMKRIGRKSFWSSNVLPRLSEIQNE